MSFMMRSFAIFASFLPTIARAACHRIDVVDGIYAYEDDVNIRGGGGQIACDCEPGDDLVSGGCFIGISWAKNAWLASNGAGRQDGAWRWYCKTMQEQNPGHSQDYSVVTVRILCRSRSSRPQ